MRGATLEKVEQILKSISYPRLELNKKKTIFCSKSHRRMITGLILSNEGKVSLGREKNAKLLLKLIII